MFKSIIGDFIVPNDTSGVELLAIKDWEPFAKDIFSKYVNRDATVIDIGAHIGYHTVQLSKVCSNGHVYSFEPNPELFSIAQRNLKEHNCNNVTLLELATSDVNGSGFLTEEENSFLTAVTNSETSRAIEMIRLDTFFHSVGPIQFIKMDVEGHEMQTLQGAKRILKRDRPIILIEIWDVSLPECLRLLSEMDYSLTHVATDNYLAFPIDTFLPAI
ncbi:MAG: FkbM family methyltransferase [Bacteroidetes bacterium]|nr:FkbM family methyltransferase [Bacteroidota bacterium]